MSRHTTKSPHGAADFLVSVRRLRVGLVSLVLALALVASPVFAQNQPVRISDSAGSSLALRLELQSEPDDDVWPGGPGPRTLVPLYDAWEIGIASLQGESPLRLTTGQRIAYEEDPPINGPATATADSVLTLVHVAKKWAGGFEGGEMSSFAGIGSARLAMLVDAGSAGHVDLARNALGVVFGLGLKQELTVRTMFEARAGFFSSHPFYLFGKHSFAGGQTNEAVFGEIGLIWPRGQTIALHVGIQGIRYVPKMESVAGVNESLTEVRLWGPFIGIQAALR